LVSVEENTLVTAPYSEDEVKKRLFSDGTQQGTRSGWISSGVKKTFRDTLKSDLLELFGVLHAGQLEFFCVIFGEIILLPKVNEAERIQ
jgi:hypothetical protein